MKLFVGARENEEVELRNKIRRPALHKCPHNLCIWKNICIEDVNTYPIRCGKNEFLPNRPYMLLCR